MNDRDFSRVSVLVVGDVMLDRYWWGTVTRVSPEAPVPVVSHDSTSFAAGGAANVAANVVGLGSSVVLVGIIGDDDEADHLPKVLSAAGISALELFRVPGRKSTVKTRIVAHNQQIVRLDQETIVDLSPEEIAPIVERLQRLCSDADVILISDYGKGFLTRDLLGQLISLANKHGKPVLVDPKGKDYAKYAGATLLTPNKREAADACGIELHSTELLDVSRRQLLEGLDLEALLITQGEDGMTLLRTHEPPASLSATARNVYDVTGAGDTVIAALAVALGSGMDMLSAAELANVAAGIVVERVGTTPITTADLDAIQATEPGSQ